MNKIERINNKTKYIAIAHKIMVENIYRSANIEGIGVTFPETQTICDGLGVSGHSIDDINAVLDLKKAWQYVFNNIDKLINIDTLSDINRKIGKFTVINAGHFRDRYDEPIHVPIGDDNYYNPPLPNVKNIENYLNSLHKDLNSALDLFCFVCKGQFFNDGNKRTATLVTNMFMLQNGLGVFSIPLKYKLEFYEKLADFYKTDENKGNFIQFLSNNCVIKSLDERNKSMSDIIL